MPWADLTDTRCYYEMRGAGAPLLAIPGLGTTCRVWDPLADDLARNFTFIAVDNRGLGQSEGRRRPTTLRDYSADLVELLDHLQLDAVHVLGLSLGGIIAQRFALDHPSRLDRLVLISCAHRFGPFLHEIAGLLGQSLRRFPPDLFARTMEVLGGGPPYIDANPQRIDQKVRQMRDQGIPRTALVQQLRCLLASEPDISQYAITAPTLVMAGQFDSLIPHCYGRAMARMIPDCRFVLLEDAGHNPVVECPQNVLFEIEKHLLVNGPGTADPDRVPLAPRGTTRGMNAA